MVSQTDRMIEQLDNIPKRSDKNISATITIRITTPKCIDADKACKKFIEKQIKKFKKNFKDFADDINIDCEGMFD